MSCRAVSCRVERCVSASSPSGVLRAHRTPHLWPGPRSETICGCGCGYTAAIPAGTLKATVTSLSVCVHTYLSVVPPLPTGGGPGPHTQSLSARNENLSSGDENCMVTFFFFFFVLDLVPLGLREHFFHLGWRQWLRHGRRHLPHTDDESHHMHRGRRQAGAAIMYRRDWGRDCSWSRSGLGFGGFGLLGRFGVLITWSCMEVR